MEWSVKLDKKNSKENRIRAEHLDTLHCKVVTHNRGIFFLTKSRVLLIMNCIRVIIMKLGVPNAQM